MRFSALPRLTLVAVCGTLALPVAFANDWPEWGGTDPGRNMYSPEKHLPARFATETVNAKVEFKRGTEDIDPKSAKNLKWVAKIGSQSYGNVSVAGGKVFIGTNNENPRDKQHQGDRKPWGGRNNRVNSPVADWIVSSALST